MKKNVMMRVASIMLVLVLLTSSVISGTFAKYVTSGESSDTARVAAFGVVVSADYSDLFKTEYATTNAWTGDDSLSVLSVYGGDVVAPGTDGELAQFDISGKPEVDVNVSYDADLVLTGWTAKGAEYCPIVFIVNGTSYSVDAYANVAAFEAAVEEAIENTAANYNAGTDLAEVEDDLAVSWKWHFMGAGEGGTGPAMQWDEYDTELGNWILNGVDPASIELNVKCTITQID